MRSPHGLRGHVRRPHVPEGRRPAAHARAVPRRGALPRGRQPLPAPARLRQHRDQRPVGRHRGDQRRAGAADDGLVDLAARLPARQRVRRRRRPRAAPAALRVRHGDARRRRRADDVARAGARPRRRRGAHACCSTATRRARRSPTRRRRSSSTPAATASTASPTTTSCAAASPARCSARSTRSSATTSSTTRGTRSSPGASPAADFLSFVEGFGGERELAVWQAIVLGLRGLGRLLDDDAYPRVPGPRPRPAGAGRRRARRPGRRARTTCAAKLRGLLVGAFAVQGDDAATQATGRELVRPGRGSRRAASTPSSSPRRRRSSPPRGDEADVRAAARRLPHGGHPAGAAAPPLRARRVRLRGARCCARASWR